MQAKIANRAWLSLITVGLFAVLPHAPTQNGNVSLPWNIGEVEPIWFHTVAFLLLVVLTIFFAVAHAQQIRAQKLAQSTIDSLIQGTDSDVLNPRDLFDMLRLPSLNRVAPVAQLVKGKYQFHSTANDCPGWLRFVSISYYAAVKLVSFIVFFCLPIGALWRAYAMVSVTGWLRIAVIVSGWVAAGTLIHVLLTEGLYAIRTLGYLWGKPSEHKPLAPAKGRYLTREEAHDRARLRHKPQQS